MRAARSLASSRVRFGATGGDPSVGFWVVKVSVRRRGTRSAGSRAVLLPRVSQAAEPVVHVADRGCLEQIGHRYPDAQGGADTPGQHHRLYRAPAEVEEVAVDAAP